MDCRHLGSRVLLALLILLGCGPARPPGPSAIIIVDIDTLRADHLGCYGYERPTSPRIDTFSRESVRFEWAFSQAPNTPPSQASILSALYPSVHGRIAGNAVLPAKVVTLAEVLRDAGYATAAFVDGGMMSAEFGMDQGFETYDDERVGIAGIDPKARAWLRERKSDPFFLLIHSYDVHAPYEKTPEPFKSMFLNGLPLPDQAFVSNPARSMKLRERSAGTANPYSLTEVEVEYAKALYDGGIRHVDDWFGSFLDFLKERDLYERSIVVLVSDHGDEFEEHDSILHMRIYSPVTRIPLLIRFPGGEPRRVATETVESIDLMPTLLDAVGLPTPAGIQGRSLLPLIRGEGSWEEIAVSESPFYGRRIALAASDFRLIHTAGTGDDELYAYRRDPLEGEDVSGQHPERMGRLRLEREKWQSLVESRRAGVPEIVEPKQPTIEQLRELGYLGE